MSMEQDMKLVVLGDIGVGKTSLIRRWNQSGVLLLLSRYVEDEYVPDYRITVDLDFSQKKLRLSPDRQLNLQVSTVCGCVWERCFGAAVKVTVSTSAVGRAREREVSTARRTDWCLLPAQPRSHGDNGPSQVADFPHSPSLD